MANATIAIDGLETLQIGLNLTTEITLDGQFAGGDGMNDVVQLLRREILRSNVRLDVRLLKDLLRGARPDPVNIR